MMDVHGHQEAGAVLGYVLYHALLGDCFAVHSLPEESFFLDYIMGRLTESNYFTVEGKWSRKTHHSEPRH